MHEILRKTFPGVYQIAFIHDANTEARKKELFAKVRSGQVRVLMGSTFKMGAGMNVQDRLIALHDLDCPWRPGDLEQRKGRIVRQGNKNKMYDAQRWWEDIMLFYIFDIEPKLSHRKEAMNLHSLIITPS